jgi:hypothetical protein
MSTRDRLTRLEGQGTVIALPTTVARIQVPADVLAVIDETIRDVRAGQLEPRTAAVIGALASVALKALEITDVAEELAALRRVLEPERQRQLPERRR